MVKGRFWSLSFSCYHTNRPDLFLYDNYTCSNKKKWREAVQIFTSSFKWIHSKLRTSVIFIQQKFDFGSDGRKNVFIIGILGGTGINIFEFSSPSRILFIFFTYDQQKISFFGHFICEDVCFFLSSTIHMFGSACLILKPYWLAWRRPLSFFYFSFTDNISRGIVQDSMLWPQNIIWIWNKI